VKNDFQNPVLNMARLATIATWALLAGGVYGQFNLPAPETPLLGACRVRK
jgi:hypothetical protein